MYKFQITSTSCWILVVKKLNQINLYGSLNIVFDAAIIPVYDI